MGYVVVLCSLEEKRSFRLTARMGLVGCEIYDICGRFLRFRN